MMNTPDCDLCPSPIGEYSGIIMETGQLGFMCGPCAAMHGVDTLPIAAGQSPGAKWLPQLPAPIEVKETPTTPSPTPVKPKDVETILPHLPRLPVALKEHFTKLSVSS